MVVLQNGWFIEESPIICLYIYVYVSRMNDLDAPLCHEEIQMYLYIYIKIHSQRAPATHLQWYIVFF